MRDLGIKTSQKHRKLMDICGAEEPSHSRVTSPEKSTRSGNSHGENRPLEEDLTRNRKPQPNQRRRKLRPKVITEQKPQPNTPTAEKDPTAKKRKCDIKNPCAQATEQSNSLKKRYPKKKSRKREMDFDEMSSGDKYSVQYSSVSSLERRIFWTGSVSTKNFLDCKGIEEVRDQKENAEQGNLGKDLSPRERPTKKRPKSSAKARDQISLSRITEQIIANSSLPEQPESFVNALKAQAMPTLPTKKRTTRVLTVIQYPLIQQSYPFSVDDIVRQLKSLDINRETTGFENLPKNEIVPYVGSDMVVPLGPINRNRPRAKVDLDEETSRVWKLWLEDINTEGIDGTDEYKAKWWEDERRVFKGRANSFIARMHLVQGDRRFSEWKGSVVDSVVGVYLTQNVSDHLSSSAFMSLAAHYPLKSKNRDKARIASDEPDECVSEDGADYHGINNTKYCMGRIDKAVDGINSPEQFADSSTNQISNQIGCCSEGNLDGDELPNRYDILKDSTSLLENLHVEEVKMSSGIKLKDGFVKSEAKEKYNDSQKMEKPIGAQKNFPYHSEEIPMVASDGKKSDYIKTDVDTLGQKSGRVRKEKIDVQEWDQLRKQTESEGGRQRTENTIESVDWEAIRCADVDEVANAIKERGMNNKLAQRIKDFLDRLVKDHGDIDLEWLRDVPPDKAKEYLLSFYGLGLKSVECVRLLTLHQLAFPVDTNVGRIAVRLGWVPLQPLPESLQLHLLELYPMQEKIQKYLWPRLCKLDQRKLYELHYQMITFGKVFCTKSKPNCNACPMRGDCRHFASAFASARLALPGPEEKSVIIEGINPFGTEERLNFPESAATKQSEPIIEEPATPEPECTTGDIEDFPPENPDEIPTIKLNIEDFTQNLHNYMQENMELHDGDLSKALVSISSDSTSIPIPKLKNVTRLRTEHQVYELPDTHPLLERMEKRETDDPSPYLLAIWTPAFMPGETPNSFKHPEKSCSSQALGQLCSNEECFSCNNIRETESKTVRGTLLIPCRTAMRGRFPLNGTYFQVNEVFADHDSSLNPIDVPRDWIWNLKRRTVYFGTSIPTIFRGLTTQEIQHCFLRGYVCVRGFDQKSRAPRPLMARLHFAVSKWKRTSDPKYEEQRSTIARPQTPAKYASVNKIIKLERGKKKESM